MKKIIDYSLYLITDRSIMSTNTLGEAVEQAIKGGCTLVQLREKELSSLDFYKMALEIREITHRHNIPLIINDRIDIALATEADGVHIGQNDIPALAARKLIGNNMILGVSAASTSEAIQAQNNGADYLGVGAMSPTRTKTDAKIVTMEELKHIRKEVSIPIVVIGGISKENAALFSTYGVDGLAVVSAIISQPDIAAAAVEMKLCKG